MFCLSPAPLCMSSVASAPTGHSFSISTTRPCPAAATGCWFTSRIRSPSISPDAACEPGSSTCTAGTWHIGHRVSGNNNSKHLKVRLKLFSWMLNIKQITCGDRCKTLFMWCRCFTAYVNTTGMRKSICHISLCLIYLFFTAWILGLQVEISYSTHYCSKCKNLFFQW